MITKHGYFWAALFILGGILGFVPAVTKNQLFLGFFLVNTPHNFLHIVSGLLFLTTSLIGAKLLRDWFKIFGAFYCLLGLVGFFFGEHLICGVISSSLIDSWGHLFLGGVLYATGALVSIQD